ncbi:hypothetical protein [Neptunicella marina]|uniref:DUF3566 domain-containing protein n=1 Tax=Neptunicella marina TaxID=2125989 RepID=A0A8J6M4E3_9ALTE|nr:hypothetical protein [Neptunicella marina]MBC3766041.1 hypothetical protein [Neptunicella marina]
MRKQITRLSLHQNAKVFGVLMAVATLPMIILMFFIFQSSMPPGSDRHMPFMASGIFMVLAPVFYFVMGYISTLIMCFTYNLMQRVTGGFEFEVENKQTNEELDA